MPSNPPANTPQVYSRLAYRDVESAIDWLTQVFGLRERKKARFCDKNGRVLLTEMELGSGLVMVGLTGNHDLESPIELRGRTQMLICYVDDVDGHYARARDAGAHIAMKLAEQPWGDRRYEVLDLEEHRWYFAEHVRDVADWMTEDHGS
jgi:uncharacterized glyoxalase superfamily protein PhnB